MMRTTISMNGVSIARLTYFKRNFDGFIFIKLYIHNVDCIWIWKSLPFTFLFQSNKSSGILLISDKHNISSPSLNSHSTLMGDACGGSKHGGNSSISIDHSSMTNSNKQRFVRGHSSPGIVSDGMDREKNPDLIPDQGKISYFHCSKNAINRSNTTIEYPQFC